jgi:hypothetical protein
LKIVKLSLLFRTYDFLYDYRKEAGKSFWDDFQQKLQQKFGDLAVESKGNFHKILYVPSEMNPEEVDKIVRSVIGEIIPDEKIYVFVAAEPTEKDIARLKTNDTDGITHKEWFAAASSAQTASTLCPVVRARTAARWAREAAGRPENSAGSRPPSSIAFSVGDSGA